MFAVFETGTTQITNKTGHEIFVTLTYKKGFGKCGWGRRKFKKGETAVDQYSKMAGEIIILVEGRSVNEFVVHMDEKHIIKYDEGNQCYTLDEPSDWGGVYNNVSNVLDALKNKYT